MRAITPAGFLIFILIASAASAQDDYDEDFPPGLLARYTAGEKTIERVDPDVAFVWGGDAPDVRLPRGPFEASWESLLLVRQPGEYRFHAYVSGEVDVEIDGARVLAGRRVTAGWIDGTPVTLGFGEKPLKVVYRSLAGAAAAGDLRGGGSRGTNNEGRDEAAAAQVRLFWSSDSFPLEPVPAHLLYRDGGNPELGRIEHGRVLFEALRCGRCHPRENATPGPPAPALTHVATGASREFLIEKVRGTGPAAATGQMPAFGFTEDEAAAVAEFLIHSSQRVKLASAGKSKDEAAERRQGEVLFRSLGCLACHRAGKLGSDGPFGGGELSSIGAKRSTAWLTTWLADPARLNADHRMPVFELSANERPQLVLYLSSLGAGDAAQAAAQEADHQPADDERLRVGRELVERARCAACHRIPDLQDKALGLPDLAEPIQDWSETCVGGPADRTMHRPGYSTLAADDVKAIRAYLAAYAGPLAAESRFERGRNVLQRQNCLACHERDTSKGIEGLAGKVAEQDEALRGQSQGLIPPALTAVGDKFVDEALARAVSGEQDQRRLPWLFVRMPRFRHTPEEKASLVEYLIGHDRIPWRQAASLSARGKNDTDRSDDPARTQADPAVDSRNESAPLDDAQLLVAGHTLVGAKGFSCVACHHVGDFSPRNVALGTRGSDLLALGKQMRQSYFLRWTRSPMRIVPGMEMPSFVKPVPEVLDGTIDTQLRAIWKALNDPRFTVPTDPSSVEQYLVMQPGERMRIVRDVFTNPKENGGGYISRALAIGFPNGHSVLYDLDRFAVRGWYFGDFARQRTLGKSWYWDMAGVPVMTGFDHSSDFVLVRVAEDESQEGRPILPKRRDGTSGRLLRYSSLPDDVRLEYELRFEIDGREHRVHVNETLIPASVDDGRAGWERRMTASRVPEGYQLVVIPHDHEPQAQVGSPSITIRSRAGESQSAPHSAPLAESRKSEANGVVLTYTAALDRPDLAVPERPPLRSEAERITTVPGFDGVRLPLDSSIMPTSITWTADGTLAFTSLKGYVYLARDTDEDGIEDSLSVFEEGLAAPYGLIADGDDLLVAHKPEVLRLKDTDGDGRADVREVVATGWGYNDNYHDWTTGFARDAAGNLYIGTGSDYAQPERPREHAKWRGKVLKVAPDGTITPVAHGFRYPMGLALNAAGDLFVTDNQGVQNTFNEINHIVPGGHYGVPGRWESDEGVTHRPPALQVPHPWTRSVNGIAFWPAERHGSANADTSRQLAGHGLGCEYDSRFLMRFTLDKVGDTYQGAAYYFSKPGAGAGGENFSGPLCVSAAPNGDLYIGSIHDSGWLGGQNTGEIVRLRPNAQLPNGLRELRATAAGFELEFFQAVDRDRAARRENYTISGYTRSWGGAYATPDTGRHKLDVDSITLSKDARTVTLIVPGRKTGHVYEVTCGEIGTDDQQTLWPTTGHYTLHRVPKHQHQAPMTNDQ